jgi:hypothetical protein
VTINYEVLHEEWDAAVVHVKAHLELGGLARRSDLICTTGSYIPAFFLKCWGRTFLTYAHE